jgi:ribosomal protein L7/L12
LQREYLNVVLEEHLHKKKSYSYLHLKTDWKKIVELKDKVDDINPAFFKQQEFMSNFVDWLSKQPKPDLGFGPAPGTVEDKPVEKKEAAKVEERIKPIVDVELSAFDPAKKISLIKEVRAMTNLGLKEAKELVEKAPVVLMKSIKRDEAEAISAKLSESGGKITLK